MARILQSVLALLLGLLLAGNARAQVVDLFGNAERATLRTALNYKSLQPGQQAAGSESN